MAYKYGRQMHCIDCGKYIGLAGRADRARALCPECYRQRQRLAYVSNKGNKPRRNQCAYLMVIRDRYDKTKLFKANQCHEGFEVIYHAPYGHLLPRKYIELPAYPIDIPSK